jgi:hypothetical protein
LAPPLRSSGSHVYGVNNGGMETVDGVDKIDEIVERAIEYTEKMLAGAPGRYALAKEGLERMRNSFSLGADDHPAFSRLANYIVDLERRFAC